MGGGGSRMVDIAMWCSSAQIAGGGQYANTQCLVFGMDCTGDHSVDESAADCATLIGCDACSDAACTNTCQAMQSASQGSCSTGWAPVWFEPRSSVTLSGGKKYSLVKADADCGSLGTRLKYGLLFDPPDVGKCYDEVANSGGSYFLYGTGSNKKCYKEKTSSGTCPEGFSTANYNFYRRWTSATCQDAVKYSGACAATGLCVAVWSSGGECTGYEYHHSDCQGAGPTADCKTLHDQCLKTAWAPPPPLPSPPPPPPATPAPTVFPSTGPTRAPTVTPSLSPTRSPTTSAPTRGPTVSPSRGPTSAPSASPTGSPTRAPSTAPSLAPTVPPSNLHPEDKENPYKDEEELTLDAVAVGGVVAGPAPGMAALALLAEDHCGNKEVETSLSMVLHPLQFSIADSVHVGNVVGNSIICGALLLLHAIMHVAVWPCLERSCGCNSRRIQVLAKQPGGLFMVFLFLYQGTTYSAAWLVLHSHEVDAVGSITGIGGTLVLTLGTPVLLWHAVLRHVPTKTHYEMDRDCGQVLRFFIGPGEWCNIGNTQWYQRYGSAIKQYQSPHAGAAVLAQVAETGLLSVLMAVYKETRNTCGPFYLIYALVFLIHGLWCVFKRPYGRPRDLVYEVLSTATLVTAEVLKAMSYMQDDVDLKVMSDTMLLVAMCLLAVKLLLDLLTELWVTVKKRRARLQEQFDASTKGIVPLGISDLSPLVSTMVEMDQAGPPSPLTTIPADTLAVNMSMTAVGLTPTTLPDPVLRTLSTSSQPDFANGSRSVHGRTWRQSHASTTRSGGRRRPHDVLHADRTRSLTQSLALQPRSSPRVRSSVRNWPSVSSPRLRKASALPSSPPHGPLVPPTGVDRQDTIELLSHRFADTVRLPPAKVHSPSSVPTSTSRRRRHHHQLPYSSSYHAKQQHHIAQHQHHASVDNGEWGSFGSPSESPGLDPLSAEDDGDQSLSDPGEMLRRAVELGSQSPTAAGTNGAAQDILMASFKGRQLRSTASFAGLQVTYGKM